MFFKVNNGKINNDNMRKFNVERILFLCFIISFIMLVIVQAALLNPSMRTFLTADSEYQGTPLGTEEYLYDEGEIGLALVNTDMDENIKVLINGDEVTAFYMNNLDIIVKDGDVVEIDGSNSTNEAEVQIVFKSDNISTDCLNKKVKIQSGVSKLIKVEIN